MIDGCEVRDYVLPGMGAPVLRLQNEASNVELRRRGSPEAVVTSGELTGDAIAWVNTCGGEVVVPGTL